MGIHPRRLYMVVLSFLLGLWLCSIPVFAHGLGDRHEVSLPASLLYIGGAGVVIVSFILVSMFAGTERGEFSYRSIALWGSPEGSFVPGALTNLAQASSVALFVLGLISGFFGPTDFSENFLTNLVWVGWWVGYTFSVIFVGNTWPILNPWKIIYSSFTSLLGRDPSLQRDYRLGDVPIVIAFLAFAWVEIISSVSESPRGMANIAIAFSLYLWFGMFVYGRDTWLEHGDPFTRLYRYLGKFAPLSIAGLSEFRMYGVGLVSEETSLSRFSGLTFLVAVLFTVTFDGFIATPEWRAIARAAPTLPFQYGTTTLLFLAGLGIFVVSYLVIATLLQVAAGDSLAPLETAGRFALSLLPIAIAYQVAHFWTFLATQGQYLVLAFFDPVGLGWKPPGLGGYEPTAEIPFVSLEFVWQSQVLVILLGHIVAVWVAHHIALDRYPDRIRAVQSQIPVMLFMVGYTLLSLWMLSRPVIPPVLP